jgi:hypothetical protein
MARENPALTGACNRRVQIYRDPRLVRYGSCESAPLGNLVLMSGKSERRVARGVVAEYHQAELGKLVARVGEAVDRYRTGELDAFEVDRVLFQ